MMNTVPFDKLGTGQSGRLAYQVLGQDGPIMNPQNIRYLSPDSAELPANALNTGASGLVASLAGANLICARAYCFRHAPHALILPQRRQTHTQRDRRFCTTPGDRINA